MHYKTFETERLYIRPTLEVDAEFILEILNTPKFHQYIGDRKVRTTDDARAYIQTRMLPQLERLGYANYTLITKVDQQKVGTCGLFDREGLEGVDIGFAFLPQFERKGYAFEAAQRIKQAAFEDFGLTQICGITTRENTSSQRLLEKLGLACTGTTYLPDDDEELLLYTLNKPE